MSNPLRGNRTGTAAVLLALTAVIGLAGCSASSGASSDSAASTSGGAVGDGSAKSFADGVAAPDKAAAGGSANSDVTKTAQGAATTQLLARTASLSMKVKDLNEAATRTRGAALAAGGQVVQENLQTGSLPDPVATPDSSNVSPSSTVRYPEGSGTMLIQVPGNKLDATLDALSRIGSVSDRQIGTEDVTGQVVDTKARLATMKESVARVRALMAQATKLSDIVTLESEVSRRQADLESLEAQLSSLNGRVAMSPITVTFWTTTAPVETPSKGFLGGLKSGWHAFTAATNAIVTAVGALLPFGILAAIVGIPVLAWTRKRRLARAVPPPPSAMQPPTDPTPPSDAQPPAAPPSGEPVNA